MKHPMIDDPLLHDILMARQSNRKMHAEIKELKQQCDKLIEDCTRYTQEIFEKNKKIEEIEELFQSTIIKCRDVPAETLIAKLKERLGMLKVAVNDKIRDAGATNFVSETITLITEWEDKK